MTASTQPSPTSENPQVVACRILAARLIEISGAIEAVRWALNDRLSPQMIAWLEEESSRFAAQSALTRTEADLLVAEASFALAKPANGMDGSEGHEP